MIFFKCDQIKQCKEVVKVIYRIDIDQSQYSSDKRLLSNGDANVAATARGCTIGQEERKVYSQT